MPTILGMVVMSALLVGAMILFSVWSGVFFIKSIVRPIGEIEKPALEIALGHLGTCIENTYHDEIG